MSFDLILKKRTRGLILRTLYRLPYRDVALEAIQRSLEEMDCPAPLDEIRVQIAYLAEDEKKYVKLAKSREAAAITARGVDLIEGAGKPDPGIELNA